MSGISLPFDSFLSGEDPKGSAVRKVGGTPVTVRIAVQGALRSLTARQRAVVLRVFDDLSEVQVAQVLDCAVGTVKSTMAHAAARLREDPQLAGLMDRESQ
jgi:DNA-directed RNA polymerase specialized sigma24 family protein